MATLIAVYNSDGCVGRCDANCYEAKHPDCDCVCGGANHGAGYKRAVENVTQMAETWIENWSRLHPDQHMQRSELQLALL